MEVVFSVGFLDLKSFLLEGGPLKGWREENNIVMNIARLK